MAKIWNFNKLSPTEFENLVFDVMSKIGLSNVKWSTPGSDDGRDIQAEYHYIDAAGFAHSDLWYIECKRHSASLSWPEIHKKVAFGDNHNADFLLIVCSSSVSPTAAKEIIDWNNREAKLKIDYWNSSELQNKLRNYFDLQVKYGFSSDPKNEALLGCARLLDMLMEYSISLNSSLRQGSRNSAKKARFNSNLSRSIQEFVSTAKAETRTCLKKFNSRRDSSDLITNGAVIESHKLDCLPFLSICSYLSLVKNVDSLIVVEIPEVDKNGLTTSSLLPAIAVEVDDEELDKITEISKISNFTIENTRSHLVFRRGAR